MVRECTPAIRSRSAVRLSLDLSEAYLFLPFGGIIFVVCQHGFDVHPPEVVVDAGDEPILVAADVEHNHGNTAFQVKPINAGDHGLHIVNIAPPRVTVTDD